MLMLVAFLATREIALGQGIAVIAVLLPIYLPVVGTGIVTAPMKLMVGLYMNVKIAKVRSDNNELRQAKDVTEPDGIWLDFEIWNHTGEFHVSKKGFHCPQCDGG